MFSHRIDVSVLQSSDRAIPMTDDNQEYVYAIGHPEGYVKIGRSSDPTQRLKAHQVSSPYDLWIIFQLPAKDSGSLEQELHTHLSDKHVRGEWFELDGYDYDDLVDLMRIGNEYGEIVTINELHAHRAQIEAALR